MEQPTKKKKLEKADKPVTGVESSYQFVLTKDFQMLGCDDSGNWEPFDEEQEVDEEWKIVCNDYEVDFSLINHSLNEKVVAPNHEFIQTNSNVVYDPKNPTNKFYPFETELEWRCFMLLKMQRLTKSQYEYFRETFESQHIAVLSYDDIMKRLENFKTQQPISSPKEFSYTYYGIENSLKHIFADPYLASKMFLEKDVSNKDVNQPYASKGFQSLAKHCAVDEIPIVLVPYLDEYRKHRTGVDKTAGLYFTLLNYDKDFLTSNMEAYSLLGNSKTNIGQFNMISLLKDEVNRLQDQSTMVYNAHLDVVVKVRILIGPCVWDSVQRWFSLFLESRVCSRCKHPKDEFYECPASVDELNKYNNRSCEEAKNYQQSLKPGETVEGYKYVSKQDVEIKDLKIDQKSKTKLIRDNLKKQGQEQLDNPFFQIDNYDIFQNSLVDLMHSEVQGDLCRHLKVMFEFFGYTEILSDFQSVLNNFYTSQGKKLKMDVKDYMECSADHFLEFVVYSPPIIYEFLMKNTHHADVSFVEKKKHIVCWSNHVSYFLILIQEQLSSSNIQLSKQKHFIYRKQAVDLYGEECFANPNFHWNSHIFEDCLQCINV